MPRTKQEISNLIHPLVPESVQHNTRVLSRIRSLTAFLLGASAGILGLQSTAGFIYYLVGTLFVSVLIHLFLIRGGHGAGAGAYFPGANGEIEGIDQRGLIGFGLPAGAGQRGVVRRKGAWRDVWLGGDVFGVQALSGFVLGWAAVGGLLR
ncbi:hypothetical protein VTN49DRAFT_4628 [Thermomyces lanuginosus]|uniref:uncharacterized protein n=1 Tax=Thermomyces lanuginosus TaxID=5541 RepID=UPI003742629F